MDFDIKYSISKQIFKKMKFFEIIKLLLIFYNTDFSVDFDNKCIFKSLKKSGFFEKFIGFSSHHPSGFGNN